MSSSFINNGSESHQLEAAISSSDELLQAQAHVWNHMFAFEKSMCLKCAIELNIPDIIHKHGKPMSLSLLSKTLKLDSHKSQCLSRIMRMLIHAKFFTTCNNIISHDEEEEEEQQPYYSLTTASLLLLKDEPMSVSPFVELILDPFLVKPWQHLSEWLLIEDKAEGHSSPFETAHGESIWNSALSKDVRLTQLFYDAMARDSALVGPVLIRRFGGYFEKIDTLVDVGGGTGNIAKAIADAFPRVTCTVLDLPHVVDGLECNNNEDSCNGNLRYVGGDMFEMIPSADVLLLKWVLHDWDDEACLKILNKCKESLLMNNGGRLLVIDMVVNAYKEGLDDNKKQAKYYELAQISFDVSVMAYINGKERTEKEWAKLFSDAGFKDYKVVPGAFGSRSLIEVYP